MPIQFPDFQPLSLDQANPFLAGMSKGQNMMQSFLKFPQDMQAQILANEIQKVNAKYAEPMAQGNLTKLNQENQWNPQIWQSEIGLRGAQAGLAGAQTKGTNVETQQNLMKLQYLQKMLASPQQQAAEGGQPGAGSPQSGQVQGAGAAPMGSPAQGAGAPPQQSQTPSVYGIDTPAPNQSDILNKMLLGIDTFTPKIENSKLQQQDQYKQYTEGLTESIKQANAANDLSQAMSIFNNAMDKSFYRGSRLGNAPSSGWMSPPGDMSPEQEADRAATQMLPSAIETLRNAMGQAKFSNLDMNMSGKLKFDRTMNDETRTQQTQWINGVNSRMKEYSKFLTSMGNPNSGAKKSEADALWSAYQQDFPLISPDGKTFQGSNMGNWPLYTTPKAIASIRATGTYSPTKSEKNIFMMSVPDGKGGYVTVPIKKGSVESAFRKGARPL